MTSSTPVSSTVSLRYATAFLDLAESQKIVAKVEKDMEALAGLLDGSEAFAAFVASPTVSKPRQQAIIEEFSKKLKLQTLTQNFLGVLIQNGRLYGLSSILRAVFKEMSKRRGEMVVGVESANVLSAAQQKALKDELDKATGKKVLLDAHVNPDLLGGLIVTVGSQRIDNSVSGRLDRLKAQMGRRSVHTFNDNQEKPKKKEA